MAKYSIKLEEHEQTIIPKGFAKYTDKVIYTWCRKSLAFQYVKFD